MDVCPFMYWLCNMFFIYSAQGSNSIVYDALLRICRQTKLVIDTATMFKRCHLVMCFIYFENKID